MKRLGLLLLAVMLVFSLAACKHDSDDDEDLVDKYAYYLNRTFSNTGNSYHLVYKFSCTVNDDGTYTAKKASLHYFYKTNANYANCSGTTLCNLVKDGSIYSSDVEYSTSPSSVKFLTIDGTVVIG